jgi:hypothetical protein
MLHPMEAIRALGARARARALLQGSAPVHVALGLGLLLVLALETLRGSETFSSSPAWPLAQALVGALALALAWTKRAQLRLLAVVALGAAFHLAWIGVHLALGVSGDYDATELYRTQGTTLLEGDYPRSEYPPGAVYLFALETWLGGGETRTANALLMIPFQIACVVGIWKLGTRWSPWLATVVALWPLNAFFWEFRFDLVPASALAIGLALASRGWWYEAGFALGFGAAVKWTPALAAAAIALWLLRTRRTRSAGLHLLGFALPVLIANLPILVWRPSELLHAYTTQAARTVTAESFVYLPISLVWDVQPGYWYFGAADVPSEANQAAIVFQVGVVLLALVASVLARTTPSAIALAGLVPVLFLLTNRIFSPQFFVLVLVASLAAAALVARRRTEVLLVTGALALSTTANTVLFQSYLGAQPVESFPQWMLLSVLTFVPTLTATAWLVVRAVALRAAPPASAR